MSPERRNKYKLKLLGKKHNARWDGLGIRASKEIRKGDEIYLNYNPNERTAETKHVLEQRAKERKAKRRGTKRARSIVGASAPEER